MRRAPIVLGLVAALVPLGGCGGTKTVAHHRIVVPRDFVGVVSEDAFARPGPYRHRQLRAQSRAGFTLIRQTFDWSQIERRPGRFDLKAYDGFVADAARAGMTVLPVLFRPPPFHALPNRTGDPVTTTPPRDPEAMARFATALVARYGPRGTLWSSRPKLPRHPIGAWQVWNEPNLPVYWGGHPDAAGYVRLLRATSRAIHAADAHAQVVTAGLPESKLGVPFADYLRSMYRAGAAGTFDILAVNAYARRIAGVLAAVAGARRVMASAEDGDVPIWVTEVGWATRPGPGSAMTVGPETQAKLVDLLVGNLAVNRRRLGVRGFVYYAWRDVRPYPGGEDFWGLHTGLLDREGDPKPSLRSFSRAVHRDLQD
jgi:hypothetical protein